MLSIDFQFFLKKRKGKGKERKRKEIVKHMSYKKDRKQQPIARPPQKTKVVMQPALLADSSEFSAVKVEALTQEERTSRLLHTSKVPPYLISRIDPPLLLLFHLNHCRLFF